MANVTIYTIPTCPYCARAKKLLESKQVKYQEIDVSDSASRSKMTALTGGKTVPQIIINEQVIGGCDDLHSLDSTGELDKLLS